MIVVLPDLVAFHRPFRALPVADLAAMSGAAEYRAFQSLPFSSGQHGPDV
jgi:hypothetical protein